MARLKERNRQIPNGLRYKCPPLKYQSSNWHSFDKIVSDVYSRIRSNPAIAQKHNLPTTREGVEVMVDEYNAMICEQNGWLDYIASGPEAPPPKWIPPRVLSRLGGGRAAAGAKTLLAWLSDGAWPVPIAVATQRSKVCAGCPQNRHVDLKDFFVHGASELLRRQIEFAHECGLDTPESPKLGICNACSCPLKLKVFVPIRPIMDHIQADVFKSLPDHCWMKTESATEGLTLPKSEAPDV